MQQFKLGKVSKMGERDPKYGQTYWAETDGSDFPVMFNSSASYMPDGASITAEESTRKTSKKGTEYLRLSKVKVLESAPAREEPAKNAPEMNTGHFRLIYSELRKQTALLEKLAGEAPEKVIEPEDDWVPSEVDMSEAPDFLQPDVKEA